MECSLCPRNCGALRDAETGNGFCRMGTLPRVARAALHFWEEPCISGQKGSGTIFFSGCVMGCVFCQNEKISRGGFGRTVTPSGLARIYQDLERQGAHNINLVNPTHFVPAILQSFEVYHPRVPVVYNSGGYEKPETLGLLEGKIDVYLPDFKYADHEKARRYSGAPDYFTVAAKAVAEMARQTGAPVFDENGMLVKGTVVRHLVLPQGTKNATGVLHWLEANLKGRVLVSLMGQYLPCGRALYGDNPELTRRITHREYEKVLDCLFETGLDGFVQELDSAKKDFIPNFDLTGVDEGEA